MYVSNSRRFIEAMGGELDIVARVGGGSVKISNFGEIERSFAGSLLVTPDGGPLPWEAQQGIVNEWTLLGDWGVGLRRNI